MAGSNAGTAYGRGAYFAEDLAKADQYTKGENPIHIFVSRVTLGRVCTVTNTIGWANRPPCESKCSHNVCAHKRPFHSVNARPGGPRFNEFVVFDVRQSYPEYLLVVRKG